MPPATDIKHASWRNLGTDDIKRARRNCIAHLLELISYEEMPQEKVPLPKRSIKGVYDDLAPLKDRKFVAKK